MVDPDLQDRLRSMIQRKPIAAISANVATTAGAIATAAMFLLLLHLNDAHKIPISIALSRLEVVLTECTGEDIAAVRARIEAAQPRRFVSFSMVGKLQAITTAIDELQDRNCVSDPSNRSKHWPVNFSAHTQLH